MTEKHHALHNTIQSVPLYGHASPFTLIPLAKSVGIGLLLLAFVLTGCANTGNTGNTGNQTSTPLTLPTKGATSTHVPSPASVPSSTATDWTTYHRDNTRAGAIANMPDPHSLARSWNMQLDGAVYAEPLVVGTHVFIATEGDSLYSLDSRTGKIQWHTNVGTPVPQSSLPCGNINPLGITGTPVYDAKTGLIFAVAEVSGPQHLLVGIDALSGKVRVRRSVNPPGMDIIAHQQRAALVLSQDMVYIAFGGLNGDCGNYHGWVVASRTDGNGSLLSYQVPTTREGGIWAASGPAVDTAGNIYVAVGNGETTQGNWDHSDSILRLSPTLQLEDGFAPTTWRQENAVDADLGSMGPLLLPNGLVFADGKGGQGYLLHADALGGIGGQAYQASICRAFGGAAALGSQVFVPCTDGIREVTIGPGATMTVGWHTQQQIAGSPVVGGHTVYSLAPYGGVLYALNSTNGSVRTSVQVGQTSHFATPTLAGNSIFIGTMTGVVAITIS
ncbi:MAG: PQQ-binding-like beta-propeller repeat protein [Chloroflexota bacterium]|nr:PQQ-binding-like beta-propeller repeat protein [Chloroflexota bacterium]